MPLRFAFRFSKPAEVITASRISEEATLPMIPLL
jgi:hypothetical protein